MPNRLAGETSPYLLQHAGNPVDWYPWGEAALSRARREDRPILLSIGYSACHWCHVMAHESFEDPNTAAVMNRLFVNIKVDREERPDLDHIYQAAHQMLTQRAGGWPLNMFLAPDGVPFFGGTYFPKSPRYGLAGFVEVLERLSEAWQGQRQAIESQNQSMLAALAQTLPQPKAVAEEMGEAPLLAARKHLAGQFDAHWGGFGGAPKFPQASDLALLLASPESAQQEMALFSLRRMAEGGLFDQLGGGFFRYSVDAQWSIPHFEKMLYDNGVLLGLYADAWAATREDVFRRTVAMTAVWALNEMRLPEGAFYSALDADSEGEEGRYYVWTREELQKLLSEPEYVVFAATYGLAKPPNFEGHAWHLRIAARLPDEALLASARKKALAARSRRVRPGCDDKVLASWNGLMIEGLLRAGRLLDRKDWIEAGQAGLDAVRRLLWRDGKLLATARAGCAHLNAYLDDYAFLLAACLESLQADYRPADLDFAVTLGEALLERFEDQAAGGFFFTSHDHETLVHRAKIGQDASTPSGNGVAARALIRLSALTGRAVFVQAAERGLRLFYPELEAGLGGQASLLAALEESLRPAPVVVVRGSEGGLAEWRQALAGRLPSNCLSFFLSEDTTGLPPVLDKPGRGHVNAWVCEGVSCLLPMDKPETLMEWFSGR